MRRGTVKKFGKVRKVRVAFVRSLAVALIATGRMTTTASRAKITSAFVDKLITRAKRNDLAARRLLATEVGAKPAKKLVEEIAPKFAGRAGGYTRVIRLNRRMSDGAPMALVELTA